MTGAATAAEVQAARDLRRTVAMPAGMLTDGEIGNEVRADSTTPERREALLAEADERRKARAEIMDPLSPEAIEQIRARLGASFAATRRHS